MDSDEHHEVIRRLFAVAGARLEVAAEHAGSGQAVDLTSERAVGFGNALVLAGQDIAALGDAIVLLAACL